MFNLCTLLIFGALAVAALCFRHRPEVHKRLMVFANIALVSASIAHLTGHFAQLISPDLLFTGLYTFLLVSVVVRDYLVTNRLHALSVVLAIGIFGAVFLEAFVIGPSATWHRIIFWISQ